MPDLSVLIAARNEMFLKKTVETVLEKIRGDTEIIVVMDGGFADPPLDDHPRVKVIYHAHSVGQRAAINEAARLSTAKFIMKLDAHCNVDEGFDVKLMADCEYDWTVIPRLYNLHAFNWKCLKCGNETFQGPTPESCQKCPNTDRTQFERHILWEPNWRKRTDFQRFDSDLHFQYWSDFEKRPEAQGDIADTMSSLGACFFMHRERYWELGGLDEGHGSWGQMGTEIACKTWLSGGRQVVNKKTWYSHMFRTQGKDFGFPYPVRGEDHEYARKYSKDMWRNNKWPKAVHTLDWLVQKFAPVPGWPNGTESKGIIYYTDNSLNMKIAHKCRKQLQRIGLPIVSASLKPIDFGKNVVVKGERGILTMFKQILAALEMSTADIIYFCEHDVLYHPSHFSFTPSRRDRYYYNENVWKIDAKSGQAVHYDCKQTSGLCAYRDLLIQHYKERVRRVEKDGFTRRMGYEPGTHTRAERVDSFKAESWKSQYPNVDIRHDTNLTETRWKQEQFRDARNCQNWIESREIPGWGTKEQIGL